MQGLHAVNGVLLVAVNALAGALGVLYVRRRGEPSRLFSHLLALGQTLLVGQAALGLLLLSGGKRSAGQAPLPLRRRSRSARCSRRGSTRRASRAPDCVWFSGASLLAAALSVRAYLTGS